MKKSNNTTLNDNQTDIFNEQYYRELRQKYGVELSGLQQGFYHVLYGNKQFLMNRNVNLNYSPQYGIYTGFSLLMLLLVLVIVVTYYKIKQKTRAFIQIYLLKRRKTIGRGASTDRNLAASADLVQVIVSASQAADHLQFIRTLTESNDSSLESVQKLKTCNYNPPPPPLSSSSFVDNSNQYSLSAHSVNSGCHSWNSLSAAGRYQFLTLPSNGVRPKDFDSLSIRTAVEFPNPNAFSMSTSG